MNNDENKIFSWCNIPLFTWDGWDTLETDTLIFYDCQIEDKQIKELKSQFYQKYSEVPVEDQELDIVVRLDGFFQINVLGKKEKKKINGREIYERDSHLLLDGWLINLQLVQEYLKNQGGNKNG